MLVPSPHDIVGDWVLTHNVTLSEKAYFDLIEIIEAYHVHP